MTILVPAYPAGERDGADRAAHAVWAFAAWLLENS